MFQPIAKPLAGQLWSEMLKKDTATRRPQTVGSLADKTQLKPIEIQGCLNRLGDSDRQLVRQIGGNKQIESRLWEISHDFIARLLVFILEMPRRTLRERLSPLIAPVSLATSLGLLLALGLFHTATRQTRLREQLRDDYFITLSLREDRQTWRATPVSGHENRFMQSPEALKLLIRHGAVAEIDIRSCNGLTTVVGLTGLTSLRTLHLGGCGNLETVPELKGLNSLQELDLKDCDKLTTVPELTDLTRLQTLNLYGCRKLTAVPKLKGLTSLQRLDLGGCRQLTTVPELKGLTNLQTLNLIGCSALTTIPDLKGLTNLQTLNLRDCAVLTTIPDLKGLTSLRTLNLRDCDELTMVLDLTGLTNLQTLDVSGCYRLTELQLGSGLDSLTQITAIQCVGLKKISVSDKLATIPKFYVNGVAAGVVQQLRSQIDPDQVDAISTSYQIRIR